MKYAIISDENRIVRTLEQEEPPVQNHIEITDEQEAMIDTARQPILLNGDIVSLHTLKVEHGDRFQFDEESGEWFVAPMSEEELAALKESKLKELAKARYESEVSGTSVASLGGAFVRTDKETQNELGKALSLLTVDPTFEIDWKFPDGTIHTLDKPKLESVAQAVFTHVQSTRTSFKDKAVLVGSAATEEEVKGISW